MTFSVTWQFTFVANILMLVINFFSIFWGFIPLLGAIGCFLSLFACVGMIYFRSIFVQENKPGVVRGRRRWRDAQID